MSVYAIKVNEVNEDGVINVGDFLDTPGFAFTFECWLIGIAGQVEDGGPTHGNTVYAHGHYAPICGSALQVRDGNRFAAQIGFTGNLLWSTSQCSTTNWQHVAVVYDGTDLRLYIDGHLEGTKTIGIGPATSMPFTIANMAISPTEAGPFSLDEIRYSSVARYTTDFIPATEAFVSDSDTIFLYHLNEGTGTNIYDSGPDGKDAIISATYSWIPGYVTGGEAPIPPRPHFFVNATQGKFTGYHLFMSQFIKNCAGGYIPSLTPDGINKCW